MALSEFSLHGCKSIRVESHLPHNGNSIRLQIKWESEHYHHNEHGECVRGEATTDLVLFGLPTDVTDRLNAAFGKSAEQAQAAE